MSAEVILDEFERDGVAWPVSIIEASEAANRRSALESAEAAIGPLHYINKIHTVMRSPCDRRIGLNVQYIAPHNKQAGGATTAMLVRGADDYGYYQHDLRPSSDLDTERAEELFAADRAMKDSFKTR